MSSFILVGNPNCGKSLLFNKLTGLSARVSNYPGITVDIKKGRSKELFHAELIDLPGVYSLDAFGPDEEVAIDQLKKLVATEDNSVLIGLIDATRFDRSLPLAKQLIKLAKDFQRPLLFVMTMVDELAHDDPFTQFHEWKKALDNSALQVVSSKTNAGIAELKERLNSIQNKSKKIHSDQNDFFWPSDSAASKKLPWIIGAQSRLDKLVFHKWWGGLLFFATMLFLFQSIFTWANPFMDIIEMALSWASETIAPYLENQALNSFVQDALIGGIGSFLIFVPQIFILFFLISLLEDSGYLARAAVICHRPLRAVGLTGKSFVPLLSGMACAIPAIMASRAIDSPWRRRLTMIVIPLLTCSARLPVYALLVAVLIPDQSLGGFIGWRGLAFFGLYLFGIVCAGLLSFLLDRFRPASANDNDVPFLLELPPYRIPHLSTLLKDSLRQSWSFVRGAGPAIFLTTVAIWLLGNFPENGQLEQSYLADLGRWLEPVFKPMGLDWIYGVAILTSFLAREVFIGSLGALYGMANLGDEAGPLIDRVSEGGLSFAAGIALLIFYALALQCISTVAVLKKEMGTWATPMVLLLCYNLFAYVASVGVYQILALL